MLVGRVVIANDAPPNILDDSTANVDADNVETSKARNTSPLENTPSPPYNAYVVPFIVADVTFVYVTFAFTWYTNAP